jgi:glycosyltransferase involved in cell wall biosynthesis
MTGSTLENMRVGLSIIMPVYNEEKNLQILHSRIRAMLHNLGEEAELIFIDDGSVDGSYGELKRLAVVDSSIKVLRFDSNRGQCWALERGFREARSEVIVKLDADMQGDPEDIPVLIAKLREGFDVVCGWRFRRNDPWHKVLKSRIGNYLQRAITQIDLHDISSPIQVYRRHIIKEITFRNSYDIFFVPVILSRYTDRMAEVRIVSRARRFGKSKYTFLRTFFGVISNYLRLMCYKDHHENRIAQYCSGNY